jgi:hypothetical protein
MGNIVAIYEHAGKFEKETPEKVTAWMRSISNETLDVLTAYLKYYKTDYILSIHKIKSEPHVHEYIRWAISSIDVMISLLAWCKKQTSHKNKFTGKTEQNKKSVENDTTN